MPRSSVTTTTAPRPEPSPPGGSCASCWGQDALRFSGVTRAAGKTLKAGVTYTVRPTSGGQLQLVAAGKEVGTFAAPLTVTGPALLNVAGLGRYRGALVFRPTRSGGIETVSAVHLEDYVRGVVSAEMPSSGPAQALDVQAIAAHAYAITSGRERPERVDGLFPEAWLIGVPNPYDAAGGDPFHRWGYQLGVGGAAAKLGGLVRVTPVEIQMTRHGGVSPWIVSAPVVGTRGRAERFRRRAAGVQGDRDPAARAARTPDAATDLAGAAVARRFGLNQLAGRLEAAPSHDDR